MSKLRGHYGLFGMLAAGLLLPAWGAQAAASELDRARELYNRTEYGAVLQALARVSPKDAPVYALIGQSYYMQGDLKKATDNFQKASSLNPRESDYYLWLGRAFGRRAETSSFVTAPGYASKAREAFEKAVELNPRNLEAISDLFEYYLDAPGFLGGGFDKASALAARMAKLNPAEGAWAQARLAEKHKESAAAEQQLRRAAELAPRQVGRVIDLAKFLAKAGRFQESDDTFRRAESIAPDSPKLMFERANMYIKSNRNIDVAKQLLKRYLDAPLTPDDPPRREAEQLLRQVSST
jgi:cytochrome c-type biogenesis protein CcmH/NrfG